MKIARRTIMLQNRDVPVQELQDEIIHTLKAPTGGGVGCVTREFFKLVVDPTNNPVDPAVHYRMRIASENRRHVFFIEYDLLVSDFKDADNAEADVAGFSGLAQLVTKPRIGDVDLFLDPQNGTRIDEGLRPGDEACRAFGFAVIDFARIGSGDWNGKPRDLLGGGLRHHDWRWQRTVGRYVERSAVWHDAG